MSDRHMVNKFEFDINRKMLEFEVNPLKSNSKLIRLKTDCNDLLINLDSFSKRNLVGFNKYAFFIFFASTHLFKLYRTKKVLHQLESKAIEHIGICLFTGIFGGIVIGQTLGNNIPLRNKVRN